MNDITAGRGPQELSGQEDTYVRHIPSMTTAAVRAALKRGTDTVIIPVGATEQHGPHAPLATDSIVAEEVAIRLATRIDALVAPLIPVSFSAQHLSFAGSISLSLDTLVQVLCEVTESLAGQGFRRFVLFSGHGGNRTAIDVAARELKVRHGQDFQVMVLNLLALQTSAELRQRVESKLGVKFSGIWEAHGGEQETAMAMARDERLVDLGQAPPEAAAIDGYIRRTRDPIAWIVSFDLPKYSAHGTWGDPRGATAEQGRVVLDLLAEMLAERIAGKWED
ncbi:MAG: creatininase family protein [Bacillota bacterium]|nr:creatininase family protein [Bacillota bacterium]